MFNVPSSKARTVVDFHHRVLMRGPRMASGRSETRVEFRPVWTALLYLLRLTPSRRRRDQK